MIITMLDKHHHVDGIEQNRISTTNAMPYCRGKIGKIPESRSGIISAVWLMSRKVTARRRISYSCNPQMLLCKVFMTHEMVTYQKQASWTKAISVFRAIVTHTISFPFVDILLHLKVEVIRTKMSAARKQLLHVILAKGQRIKTSRHRVDQSVTRSTCRATNTQITTLITDVRKTTVLWKKKGLRVYWGRAQFFTGLGHKQKYDNCWFYWVCYWLLHTDVRSHQHLVEFWSLTIFRTIFCDWW